MYTKAVFIRRAARLDGRVRADGRTRARSRGGTWHERTIEGASVGVLTWAWARGAAARIAVSDTPPLRGPSRLGSPAPAQRIATLVESQRSQPEAEGSSRESTGAQR